MTVENAKIYTRSSEVERGGIGGELWALNLVCPVSCSVVLDLI